MIGSEPQDQQRKKSVEAISAKLLTGTIAAIAILVFVLAVLGQIELMIGVIIAVSVGIAWRALRFNELSTTRAERFQQLRRIASLRKEDTTKPSPVLVFGVAVVFAVIFCRSLTSSWRQYSAADFPMVQGQITRYEMVDVDLGSQLEVEYDYQVAGKRFHGNRLRFVYRAFRVGTDDAKKLAATWGLGNNVSVFYEPHSPTNAVLDNTFCKGDQLQVGLNASGLLLSVIVMIGAAYVQLRTRETKVVVAPSHEAFVVPLSNIPLLGACAALIAIGALTLTFLALLGGLISMGDGEIPWLVTMIDCLYATTIALFAIAFTIYVGERASFGIGGRRLVIDQLKQTISWSSETFADTISHDFAKVKWVRVVSNREDWHRMGRTFSVVALCEVGKDEPENKTIQRFYSRRDAVTLSAVINSLIATRANNVLDFERIRDDACVQPC